MSRPTKKYKVATSCLGVTWQEIVEAGSITEALILTNRYHPNYPASFDDVTEYVEPNNDNSRIPFDEYLILMAHTVKLRSHDKFRAVGAVCASIDNRILSCGYNGLVSKFEPPNGFYDERENPEREMFTLHAEQNSISLCQRGEVHTVAITCSPCQYCSKLMAGFGVKRVIFSEEYAREVNYKKIFDFYKIEYKIVETDFSKFLK